MQLGHVDTNTESVWLTVIQEKSYIPRAAKLFYLILLGFSLLEWLYSPPLQALLFCSLWHCANHTPCCLYHTELA